MRKLRIISQSLQSNLAQAAVVIALQTSLLVFFVSVIPLHRMYGWADSGEYQRMALYLAREGPISGGYAQYFPPGVPAVVSLIYFATRNIDYAGLIANYIFALGALLVFLRFSHSLRLTILLMFVPVWMIISFSTLADVSFILLQLAAVYLMSSGKIHASLAIAAASTIFRLEGFFLMIALLAAMILKKQFRFSYLLFPAVSVMALLIWGELAFGNPLIIFSSQARQAWAVTNIARTLEKDMSLGIVGFGQIVYIILTVFASILTILKAKKDFGIYNIIFLLSLVMTLAHTILTPFHLFPEMARLYLYVAPFTLVVFKNILEKWFVVVLPVTAVISIWVGYVYWTTTFSVAFI